MAGSRAAAPAGVRLHPAGRRWPRRVALSLSSIGARLAGRGQRCARSSAACSSSTGTSGCSNKPGKTSAPSVDGQPGLAAALVGRQLQLGLAQAGPPGLLPAAALGGLQCQVAELGIDLVAGRRVQRPGPARLQAVEHAARRQAGEQRAQRLAQRQRARRCAPACPGRAARPLTSPPVTGVAAVQGSRRSCAWRQASAQAARRPGHAVAGEEGQVVRHAGGCRRRRARRRAGPAAAAAPAAATTRASRTDTARNAKSSVRLARQAVADVDPGAQRAVALPSSTGSARWRRSWAASACGNSAYSVPLQRRSRRPAPAAAG